MSDAPTRNLSREQSRDLRPGSNHFTAYVGPPDQWDFMGATQFRLLTALGLRERHKLLDFGCGSLRAGRFLITYLGRGNYFGIEPNKWLIDDAIEKEIGADLVRLKQPTFAHNDDFTVSGLGQTFDFIVAQSIFSHAGPELVSVTLEDFARCLAPCGVVLATFLTVKRWPGLPVETPGWTYPGCTSYAPERILDLIRRAGLVGRELPWYHPRQTWYAMSLSYDSLPAEADDVHLSGAVLNDKEFAQSRKPKNE